MGLFSRLVAGAEALLENPAVQAGLKAVEAAAEPVLKAEVKSAVDAEAKAVETTLSADGAVGAVASAAVKSVNVTADEKLAQAS